MMPVGKATTEIKKSKIRDSKLVGDLRAVPFEFGMNMDASGLKFTVKFDGKLVGEMTHKLV